MQVRRAGAVVSCDPGDARRMHNPCTTHMHRKRVGDSGFWKISPEWWEKFNSYRFADYKEQVVDLTARVVRVVRVSVETMEIVAAMAAVPREEAAVAAILCAQVRALFLRCFPPHGRKTTALQVSRPYESLGGSWRWTAAGCSR